MTRKDYLLIAEALRVQRYRAELEITHAEESDKEFACGRAEGVDSVAMELCDALHRDNPGFDRVHFLAVVRGEKELTSKPQRNSDTEEHAKILARLIKEAKQACKFRGHVMIPFVSVDVADGRETWVSECNVCHKGVHVQPSPAPNGIDIGGSAVALGCADKE